jgi:SAM-dependent methyltransferase
MKDFWNQRYADSKMAYGEDPNTFFKDQISILNASSILLPAEGEGRNAVFAAKLGWEVSAFDISIEGKKKAEKLAQKNHVKIDYRVGDLENVDYEKEYFDCLGLIYAHFPADQKSNYHKILNGYLRKGGIVIFEAFSKKHLKFSSKNPKSGGPKNIEMLFSIEEIKRDFYNCDIIELSEKELTLDEGIYHVGMSSVIRFVGKKK